MLRLFDTLFSPKIGIEAKFCSRMRYKNSHCSYCFENCPKEALFIHQEKLTIGRSCNGCGICINACPNEVFFRKVKKDEEILSDIKTMLKEGYNDSIFFSCNQVLSPASPLSITLTCVGGLTENLIVGSVLYGATKIEIWKWICSECENSFGEKYLKKSIASAHLLLELLNLSHVKIDIKEGETKPSRTIREDYYTRREIFSFLKIKSIEEPENTEVNKEEIQGRPIKRHLLLELSKERKREYPFLVDYKENIPFGKLVNKAECQGCGVCAHLCPTGAILKRDEGEDLSFYFNFSLCLNCGLCIEACRSKALEFHDTMDLSQLLNGGYKKIAAYSYQNCAICKGKMINRRNELCISCSKRFGHHQKII